MSALTVELSRYSCTDKKKLKTNTIDNYNNSIRTINRIACINNQILKRV